MPQPASASHPNLAATQTSWMPPPYLNQVLRAPTPTPEWSAISAVRVTASVNLLHSRRYHGMSRAERVATVAADNGRFIATLLGLGHGYGFELRISATPTAQQPIEVHLLTRVWSADREWTQRASAAAAARIVANLPGHVDATVVADPARLQTVIAPYPSQALQAVAVTKREITGTPARNDAGMQRFFAVVPFTGATADWQPVYVALAASPVPVTVSIALFPLTMPVAFAEQLTDWATYYGRLALEDELRGGLSRGARKLPPDAFAVDAAVTYADIVRRTSTQAVLFRAMVCGPQLPDGLPDQVGVAVSGPVEGPGSAFERIRAADAYSVRHYTGEQGQAQARWNLEAVDCLVPPGAPHVWQHPSAPGGYLPMLATLGDTTDAGALFGLPAAIDGAVPGFAVRRGSFGHAESYAVAGDALVLGTLAGTGGQTLQLPVNTLVRHGLVCGSPGSGKSTTVLGLLRQLWVDHHVPFLVIEPVNADGNDYRSLSSEPGFEALRVITVGDETLTPLRFNPFAVPKGVSVDLHVTNLLTCFTAAFGLWPPLPEIYRSALAQTYLRAGILTSEVGGDRVQRWPTVVDFLAAMSAVLTQPPYNAYQGEVKANVEAAGLVRAQQLTTGVCAGTFLTECELDPARLLSGPVVLELPMLGNGDERALMMALLLNVLTEWYKANRPIVSHLVHLTVVEEAHQLLTRPSASGDQTQARAKEQAAAAFANTLAENRKYGEGVLLVEQMPSKLVVDAVANTNIKVLHRLTGDADRAALVEGMGLDEPQRAFVATLETGEAVVSSVGFAEAAHVHVSRAVTGPALPPPAVAAPPFPGCHWCRVKCRYRGPALALHRDPVIRSTLANRRDALLFDVTPQEARARWQALLDELKSTVKRFASFPSEEPALSDAAYCVYLHGVALDVPQADPAFADTAARRLGLKAADATIAHQS